MQREADAIRAGPTAPGAGEGNALRKPAAHAERARGGACDKAGRVKEKADPENEETDAQEDGRKRGARERNERDSKSCGEKTWEKKDGESNAKLQDTERRRVKEAPRSASNEGEKFRAHPGPASKRAVENNEQLPT